MIDKRIFAAAVAACIFSLSIAAFGGEEMKSGFAKVNGTKLYYEMKGTGPAVVFIHEGGLDRRMWDNQFDFFADRYKVIRYDTRGHGKSGFPTKPFSEVDDLYQLLRFLKVNRAHMIGLSLGGRIAVDFALAHPEMVETLVPVAAGLIGFPYSPEVNGELMKIVYSIQKEDGTPAGEMWLQSPFHAAAMENPAVVNKLRSIATENSRFWLIHPFFSRPLFPLAIQRLTEVNVPTLVIVGDRDVTDMQKQAEMLATGIPNAKKIVIRGADHAVNMEKSEEFNAAVLDFLSKH